jgi:hypothetical protein
VGKFAGAVTWLRERQQPAFQSEIMGEAASGADVAVQEPKAGISNLKFEILDGSTLGGFLDRKTPTKLPKGRAIEACKRTPWHQKFVTAKARAIFRRPERSPTSGIKFITYQTRLIRPKEVRVL